MKKAFSILGAIVLLSVGCTKGIDYKKSMYVSSTKYETISCKELDYELYNYGHYSCKELKEKLLYISPAEYEKLSCKQLHEQLIKINGRLESKSKIETEETAVMMIGVPFFLLTTAGVPYFFQSDADVEAYQKKVDRHDSEVKRLKEEYKALKEIATKKNCGFSE